jgi:outer membrane protein TolC
MKFRLFALVLCALISSSRVALCQAPPAATITLKDALARARQYGGQFQAANLALLQAREDTKQARAARLPSLNALNQFIYTEGNGTPSGVFVANDGVHVYNEQAVAHEDLGLLLRQGEMNRALAAEAVARAKTEVAARGMNATVIQNYYAIVTAEYRLVNLKRSVTEAEQFVDITTKQEKGGEVAHADVLKGQLDLRQRQRDLKEAQLGVVKAKIALGVIIFPNYNTDFSVEDDLQSALLLPSPGEAQAAATSTSPDLKVARAGVQQAGYDVSVARYALLPTFALDFFYGIDANQFAARTHYSVLENGLEPPYRQNLGYSAQATLTIPVWNWGATRSRIKQAEFRRQQAELDLTLAQRTLQGNLATAYAEASLAREQLESLRESSGMATESLRLTLLRYQAGESTALEVVDAQNTLTLARNAYADGLVRYRVASANLQTLTGNL